jgi:hypothetical protein
VVPHPYVENRFVDTCFMLKLMAGLNEMKGANLTQADYVVISTHMII